MEFACPVDPRRFKHFVGNGECILADQEDAEHSRDRRNQHAAERIDQTHFLADQEQRDHRDLRRDHKRSQQKLENSVAPGKLELCKGITSHDVERQR